MSLLVALVAIVFGSASHYGSLAVATSNEYGRISQSESNEEFLLNCLLNDGTDGDIQWFEPLGCSSDSSNIQAVGGTQTPTSDGSENPDISLIDSISDEEVYADGLYSHNFEDPNEVGWD